MTAGGAPITSESRSPIIVPFESIEKRIENHRRTLRRDFGDVFGKDSTLAVYVEYINGRIEVAVPYELIDGQLIVGPFPIVSHRRDDIGSYIRPSHINLADVENFTSVPIRYDILRK